jgi:hypothetical protein
VSCKEVKRLRWVCALVLWPGNVESQVRYDAVAVATSGAWVHYDRIAEDSLACYPFHHGRVQQ